VVLKGIAVETALLTTSLNLVNGQADLGFVPVGAVSERQEIVVTNTTTGPLEINTDRSNLLPVFVVNDDLCDGKVLAPNASCSIFVRFFPTNIGPRLAVLTISRRARCQARTQRTPGPGGISPPAARTSRGSTGRPAPATSAPISSRNNGILGGRAYTLPPGGNSMPHQRAWATDFGGPRPLSRQPARLPESLAPAVSSLTLLIQCCWRD
jgi:hypothetical protein